MSSLFYSPLFMGFLAALGVLLMLAVPGAFIAYWIHNDRQTVEKNEEYARLKP